MYFETSPLDKTLHKASSNNISKLSPWHDIPLGFEGAPSTVFFNYVQEIPKGDRAKMECSPKEEWNPIKQDIKKGNLRFFKYGDLPFNYGFIPQTWEDPNRHSHHADVSDLKGDNDPLDVVEISGHPIPRGQVVPVKALGVLGLIDEGEADWKIIAIRADHPKAVQMHTIKDADRILHTNVQEIIVDWFRKYKVPDGKPENHFTHSAQYQGPDMAVDVIEETHRQWYDLIIGAVQSENSLQSVTRTHLLGQGVTSSSRRVPKPQITYDKYDNWNRQKFTPASNLEYTPKEPLIEEEGSHHRKRM